MTQNALDIFHAIKFIKLMKVMSIFVAWNFLLHVLFLRKWADDDPNK